MIQALINRYKRMRSERFLAQTFERQYAFVGMGQHSLTNLYPVLHYLQVPLKYICVTSERKALLIEKKFRGVRATTSLAEVLADESISGVLVAASPTHHFSIASQVLQSGKSLFIEKPPCLSLQELDTLIDTQRQHCSPLAMAGLQKRYAPSVQLLQKRLRRESHIFSYDLHYRTGAYPEGNALFDLYIHPLDLVCHLFGTPTVLACQRVADHSFLLMLQHPHTTGTLELSTAYTWTGAEESLTVNTSSGIYQLSPIEQLTFSPKQPSVLGIPLEKVHPQNERLDYLFRPGSFVPILPNNQLYTQGFFGEVQTFVQAVEGQSHAPVLTALDSLRDTFTLLHQLQAQ